MKRVENSVYFTHRGVRLEAFYIPNEYCKGEFDPLLKAIFTETDSGTDILGIVSEACEIAAYNAAIAKERG